MALTPGGTIFFGSSKSAGFIQKPGEGFAFCEGQAAEVRIHGDSLFLLLKGEGVYRCKPVKAFEEMGQSIAAELDKRIDRPARKLPEKEKQ